MVDLSQLPNPQKRAIDIVREVAAEKRLRPFLVGGPVRDLLLGRQAIDIDLTIEEEASDLARAVARRIDGRVKSFPQFMTYKVTAADLPEIDIATARKERYRTPGALPTVSAGKLNDDLLRRDFSINAMACDLADGRLHDPAGGAADLGKRQIRVLHDRSFIDDPTRILRALRFAGRLGFTLEPHTWQLLCRAIADGAFRTVSKERIWRELFLAMDERQAPEILAAAREAGVLDALFRARADGDLLRRLQMARSLVEGNPDLDRYALFTAMLLHGDASPVDLEGSGFSQKRARNVMQLANELPRFLDSLAEARSDRQKLRILRSASPEMLSLIAATSPPDREMIDRFRDFERFQLPIRGNELEVPAGPHVSRALERTREAVFAGEIRPDEALAHARRLAQQYLDGKIEN
ncbi:MAG TPA: hypothetical protein VNL91_11145 [Thermoanaerobaculia bacterium]|nr:hypothetical protein [Thermoanaerobaculia bacterium]